MTDEKVVMDYSWHYMQITCCILPFPMEEWDEEKRTIAMQKARQVLRVGSERDANFSAIELCLQCVAFDHIGH